MTDTVRVPREPTEAMIAAGERAAWDDDNSMPAISAMRKAWPAMLAASPQGESDWITHDGGPNPVPCPFCAGAGYVPGDQGHEKCGECDGTGNTEGVKP